MNKPEKKISISLKINEKLYLDLIDYKSKNNINLSEFIRSCIADRLEYLKLKRKKNKWF